MAWSSDTGIYVKSTLGDCSVQPKLILKAGATVVRFWAYQTYTDGGRDLTGVDRVIRSARKAGMRVLPVLEDGPGDCTTGDPGVSKQEYPGDVLLVTQNVDGLHGAAGSERVIDLHGRIDTVVCLACRTLSPRAALQEILRQRNPAWAVREARAAPDGDADLEHADFAGFDVPACPPIATSSTTRARSPSAPA